MKGKTNNPNGRPKGTPNKITTDLRQSIQSFLNANWDSVQAEFDQLEAREKLSFIEKLLKYAVPALQATTIKTDFEAMSEQQLDLIINRLTNE